MNFLPLRAKIFPGVGCFRAKLLVAMTLVVAALTAAGLFLSLRNVAAETAHDLRREFQGELATLHSAQEIRHAALAERCRTLVRNPRLHAALEDDALDLLYLSARDELRDVMAPGGEQPNNGGEQPATGTTLHACFYRFLDASGAVIPPLDAQDVGGLEPQEETRLALPGLSDHQQIGYLVRGRGGDDPAAHTVEIRAMPIFSSQTGEVIAALVLGFQLPEEKSPGADAAMKSGLWLESRLHLPTLAKSAREALEEEVGHVNATPDGMEKSFVIQLDHTPYRIFSKVLNPGSQFAPTYEVCVYPLTELHARQRELTWQFLSAGALLFLVGLGASHFLSGRLAVPVERLAVDSVQNRVGREQAEAKLELTSAELQRAARFSADASHQLKTPVTVLRAGLEELLAQDHLSPGQCEEISALVHQTYRLTSIVEDLLLLSRMDAGRLHLQLRPVDLVFLLGRLLDDLSTRTDGLDVDVETDFPPALAVAGEERYTTIILQNLLENARKYNWPDGRIRVAAREDDDGDGGGVLVTVGNTGPGIPPGAREHIFERFHRGAAGEDVPGHGLGLNLARELARLHGGDLRLACTEPGWTEFAVRFRLARRRTAPTMLAPA